MFINISRIVMAAKSRRGSKDKAADLDFEGCVISASKLKGRSFPRKTKSLCPECKKIIDAELYEEDGALKMRKSCPEHGPVKDVVWSDFEMYKKAEDWAFDGYNVDNPQITDAKVCPHECGLCQLHLSRTCLANLDLTNRCNLRCPICFANANAAGYVYEPTYEQVVFMLKVLRDQKPVPVTAVQFSGGEPTIYPRFVDVVKAAHDMGFLQVQAATNGIKFANYPEFLKRAVDAGLHTIYLQFDGLREENYVAARGQKLLETKKKVVENVKNLKGHKPSIVLVPTIVNTINDDQCGEILNYAIENSDVVRGVNFQPVALSGRILDEEREKLRFTMSDLVDRLEKQTGYFKKEDWYTVPFVTPISELASALQDDPKMAFTSHPACGLATYFFVDDKKNVIPITRFVDVEGLMKDFFELSQKAKGARVKLPSKAKALLIFTRHFKSDKAPEGLGLREFKRAVDQIIGKTGKKGMSDFSWRMMYVGGMHFQDSYNYDHYTIPDGRLIPFCAYNSGPTFRTEVEKEFSVPLEVWRKRHGDEYT
jgi:uncharacterized radical SAM superfamily Fe-S cluster-containing enzyme